MAEEECSEIPEWGGCPEKAVWIIRCKWVGDILLIFLDLRMHGKGGALHPWGHKESDTAEVTSHTHYLRLFSSNESWVTEREMEAWPTRSAWNGLHKLSSHSIVLAFTWERCEKIHNRSFSLFILEEQEVGMGTQESWERCLIFCLLSSYYFTCYREHMWILYFWKWNLMRDF